MKTAVKLHDGKCRAHCWCLTHTRNEKFPNLGHILAELPEKLLMKMKDH